MPDYYITYLGNRNFDFGIERAKEMAEARIKSDDPISLIGKDNVLVDSPEPFPPLDQWEWTELSAEDVTKLVGHESPDTVAVRAKLWLDFDSLNPDD